MTTQCPLTHHRSLSVLPASQKSGAAVKIIRKMGKLERRKIFKMKKSGLSGMEQDSSDDEE